MLARVAADVVQEDAPVLERRVRHRLAAVVVLEEALAALLHWALGALDDDLGGQRALAEGQLELHAALVGVGVARVTLADAGALKRHLLLLGRPRAGRADAGFQLSASAAGGPGNRRCSDAAVRGEEVAQDVLVDLLRGGLGGGGGGGVAG